MHNIFNAHNLKFVFSMFCTVAGLFIVQLFAALLVGWFKSLRGRGDGADEAVFNLLDKIIDHWKLTVISGICGTVLVHLYFGI